MRPQHRRAFLATSLAAGALAFTADRFSSCVQAADPVARTGTPKFKFSVAGYSYQKLLTGMPPALTFADFVNDCAAMQVEGVELTSYYFPDPLTDDYIHALRAQCFRLGMDVSGTAVANDFCHPPGEKRDHDIAHVKRWVDRAVLLGAPVIRIFSGGVHEGQSEQEARRLAIAGLEECCHYAGGRGIYLGLENHGGLSTKISDLVSLVKEVQSPFLGINLDSGNFQGCASPEEAFAGMELMAPFAVNVQIKVKLGLMGGSAPTDFGRIAQILKSAGYRGYIVLEYEEADDPRTACPKYVDQLRQAFLG